MRDWTIPGSNKTDTVLFAESGLNHDEAVRHALSFDCVIVSGNDETVGLGGHIQGGTYGPLSSTFGLAADNVYRVRVVTSDDKILVADAAQNQDLLRAIRGWPSNLKLNDDASQVTPIGSRAHSSPALLNDL